jgi:hypothetical protein
MMKPRETPRPERAARVSSLFHEGFKRSRLFLTMDRNVGILDRIIRAVVGILLLGLYGALEPPLKYATLIGLIPLGTAILGSCPLYTLLGISTRRRHRPRS